jgi:3-phytase
MHKIESIFILITILITGCQNSSQKSESGADAKESMSVSPEVAVIKEAFSTVNDQMDNVDSPALWHGDDGQNWLLATAKEGNVIIVYNAATGEKITSVGQYGSEPGELSRPNGIAVIDSFVVVIERDNHRVQVFVLPEMKPLAFFGETVLRSPYGITIDYFDGKYNLYVTDNYSMPDESTPPADSLGQRVHRFEFTVQNGELVTSHISAFGETSGEGVLYKVESILLDRMFNRLIIADEHESHCNIKIYNTDGRFTGQIIPHDYFFYEPEGIALWSCSSDTSGYYIITDQGKLNNTFQIFDRKTLEYIGGFKGETTRNTDGIALTQKTFGDFKFGALYPVHDDGSITAINWEDIARRLNLSVDCK